MPLLQLCNLQYNCIKFDKKNIFEIKIVIVVFSDT